MAEPAETSETADVAAPDWESITRNVKCPLCGYNLRGLVEPRCPECGYQFEWQRIFHPERDLHPYLFEHYPGI
jgi:tRNA(Ile2) C34 agmatinyltransferase TiaS